MDTVERTKHWHRHLDRVLKNLVTEYEVCQRLLKIPGVGTITATILLTLAGRAGDFKNGREFAAFLGLCHVSIPLAESNVFSE